MRYYCNKCRCLFEKNTESVAESVPCPICKTPIIGIPEGQVRTSHQDGTTHEKITEVFDEGTEDAVNDAMDTMDLVPDEDTLMSPPEDVQKEEVMDPGMFKTARSEILTFDEIITKKNKSPVEIKLFVKKGPQFGKFFTSRRRYTVIGRGDQADIVIKDVEVSRKHAAIEVFNKDSIYLIDLSSVNGTYLNGSKISKSRIIDNDEIVIGNTYIEFNINHRR